MIRVAVEVAPRAYEVRVGAGLLADLAPALREVGVAGRVAVIADDTALALHGAAALATLGDAPILAVPPGEGSKSIEQAQRLWGALIEAGIGRGDCVLALGGGVVGDLAGFVAATLHRGIDLVQVPTTLLAQVDASVGGKVAIDHPLGKNLIGAFHQPRLVVADVGALATLPARERWSGLAEIAKAALLGDAALFARLEAELETIAAAPPAEVVARAVAIKARVVAADEREGGLRRVLNLGHTVGHALEHACAGALTHGEAVVYGMRAAIRLSQRRAGLAAAGARRALALLDRFPVPPLPPLDREALLALALRDKKRVGGAVHFVVVPALGQAATLPADARTLREAIDLALEAA